MTRRARIQRERRGIALTQLPGFMEAARGSNVYVERRDGETIASLMEGICLAGMEALPGRDFGCSDGGAEIQLRSGAALSCVGTGQHIATFREAVAIFAAKSGRLVAEFDGSGQLKLSDGRVVSDTDALFYAY